MEQEAGGSNGACPELGVGVLGRQWEAAARAQGGRLSEGGGRNAGVSQKCPRLVLCDIHRCYLSVAVGVGGDQNTQNSSGQIN